MTIFAIDAATTTGWALMMPHGLRCGTRDFGQKNDRAVRLMNFYDWLDAMLSYHPEVTMIAYEKPIFRGSNSFLLMGFCALIEMFCARRSLDVLPVNLSTIKKHAGVKAGEKPIAEARARGWKVANDHEADAAFLLDYATQQMERLEAENETRDS